MSEEDDPVVEEIPVFLSRSLSERLYLFQYPTLPVGNVSQLHVVKSRIKPENQEVCLEIGLKTRGPNYDSAFGEDIAKGIDTDKEKDKKMFDSNLMDVIHFESSKIQVDPKSLVVGMLVGKELHLSPVQGVVSLAPSFAHLNDVCEDVQNVSLKDSEDFGEQGRRVRPESKARGASYKDLEKKSNQEAWFNTQYYDSASHKSVMERHKLKSETTELVTLSKEGYMDCVITTEEKTEEKLPSLPDNMMSLSALRSLPLQERIRSVLKEVVIMTFSQLMWIVGDEPERVAQGIQSFAVLVQGNWVLRSDILYPKDSFSTHNGVPSEYMGKARDYILYQLNEGKVLERKKLSSEVKLPSEELKEIMSQLAFLKRNKQWKFKLPPDNEFLNKYPTIVEQQNTLWQAKYKQLVEICGYTSPKPPRKRRESSRRESESETVVSRRRKNSSISSDSELSESSTKPDKNRNRKNKQPPTTGVR